MGFGDQMLICVQNGQGIGDDIGVYGKYDVNIFNIDCLLVGNEQ